jgi:hypothetical protein
MDESSICGAGCKMLANSKIVLHGAKNDKNEAKHACVKIFIIKKVSL